MTRFQGLQLLEDWAAELNLDMYWVYKAMAFVNGDDFDKDDLRFILDKAISWQKEANSV